MAIHDPRVQLCHDSLVVNVLLRYFLSHGFKDVHQVRYLQEHSHFRLQEMNVQRSLRSLLCCEAPKL